MELTSGLYDRKGKEIKLGDKIMVFKVGHKPFKAEVLFQEGCFIESEDGRLLRDYGPRLHIEIID